MAPGHHRGELSQMKHLLVGLSSCKGESCRRPVPWRGSGRPPFPACYLGLCTHAPKLGLCGHYIAKQPALCLNRTATHKTDDHAVAATSPPMGWSAWKAYHFETSEKDVQAAADGLVSSGMRAAGYHTLSLDGGYWGGGKSGEVRRNASGFLTVNDTKFPCSGVGGNGGLRSLSDYVTSRGFLFGMYTAAGKLMCSKDVGGSAGYEGKARQKNTAC